MVASYDYWKRGGGGSATGGSSGDYWNPTVDQFTLPNGRRARSVTGWEWGGTQPPTTGPPGSGGGWTGYGQPGTGQQPGGGFQNPGTGGGWYGNPGDGGTPIPGSNPPSQNPSTSPLFTKADTDRAVSQAAANAFGQADPYSLKVASGGNGLSFGAGQQSMINPLLASAGTAAKSAAKQIPIQDALANQEWLLGGQTDAARDALNNARLGEYQYQTGQMGSDYFQKLLIGLLGGL